VVATASPVVAEEIPEVEDAEPEMALLEAAVTDADVDNSATQPTDPFPE